VPITIHEIIKKFASDMKQLFGNEYRETIVYGSYARGDYNENSDIDVMILVAIPEDEISKFTNAVSDLAFEYFMEYGVDIAPIVKNEEHFNGWVDDLPYYNNVRNEGVQINV